MTEFVKPTSPRQAAVLYAMRIAFERKIDASVEFLMEWSGLPRHVVEKECRRISERGVKAEKFNG